MKHITLFLVAALTAAPAFADAPSASASLYQRLGGEPAIRLVSSELIDRVAADPKLGSSFKDSNLRRIKDKLAEQLCELTGGPCHYSGDSMRETHAGHHIGEAEFNGMVHTLLDVLHEHAVPERETTELIQLLAPMKGDIVEKADGQPR